MKIVDDIDRAIEDLQRIEALDKGIDYSSSGRPPLASEAILRICDPSASDYIAAIEDNAKILTGVKQTALSHTHMMILHAWGHIEATLNQFKTNIPDAKRVTPTLFSLGLGTFSAISIRDQSGRLAIGIDEDFLAGMFLVTHVVINDIEEWAEHGYIARNYARLKAFPTPSVPAHKALRAIIDSVVSTGKPGGTVESSKYIYENYRKPFGALSNLVWFRICTFIVAHEYSHYIYDHHLGRAPTDSWRKTELDAVKNLIDQKYSELGRPSQAQVEFFLGSQADEYHADQEAHRLLALSRQFSVGTKEHRRLFMSDILAISVFFSYCESIERISLLRLGGRDPAESRIFRNDAAVSDLFFWREHPSLYRRFHLLLRDIERDFLRDSEGAAHYFSHPVVEAFNILTRLEAAMKKVSPPSDLTLLAKKWASRPDLQHIASNLRPDKSR